jgi:hypothetical protein
VLESIYVSSISKEMIMKKVLLMAPVLAVLAACSTPSEQFDRRAYEGVKQQEKRVERAIDQAPKWMMELPKSTTATYENGSSVSADMGMAVHKAKLTAFGKICMSAGGRVDQQSKMFRTDTEAASTEFTEMAVRTMCPGVDITGVQMVETKLIAEGSRFRAYVLMALPFGDANVLARERDSRELHRGALQRSSQAFREMDANREQLGETKLKMPE